jgi:ADP-heptose:LPS heptosyltransferase
MAGLYIQEIGSIAELKKMPMYTGVSIIIPVHNGEWVSGSFDTIFRNTQKYELIVIDNGSDERMAEYLRTLAENGKIRLIRNEKNEGFGKACNQGARAANYELLLFLNDDVICYENWLDILVNGLKLKDLDACAPKGGVMNAEWKGVGETSDESFDYLVGWCILIKKEVFNRVHGFDERFEMAFCEDSDLSFTLRARGYNIGIVETNIVHLGSLTVKSQQTFAVSNIEMKNREKLKAKWSTKNIHLRRTGARGDVLMMTPIVREMKKKYPKSRLSFITLPESAEVLKNNPYIDEIITNIGYQADNIQDLNYERNPGKNRLEVVAEKLRIKLTDKSYDLIIPDKVKKSVTEKLAGISKKFVVFHTGRTWANREWNLNYFRSLGLWLQGLGYIIIEVGNTMTPKLGFNYLATKLSIQETAEVIRRSDFFVGVDSLCLHIASAMKKRSFCIYGVIEPQIVRNNDKETSFYVKGLFCRNCKSFGTLQCNYNIMCINIPYLVVKQEIERFLKTGIIKDYVGV